MDANAGFNVPTVECNPIKDGVSLRSSIRASPQDGLARTHSARCHWSASPIGQPLHASEASVNMSAWQASNHILRREEHPIAGESENQGYLALATHPSDATGVSKREHYSRLQNETMERVPGTWSLFFPCIAWLPSDCFFFFLETCAVDHITQWGYRPSQ
jgi:hypothetical protein